MNGSIKTGIALAMATAAMATGMCSSARAGMAGYTSEGAWASSVIPGTLGNANFSPATFSSGVYVNSYPTSAGGYTVSANGVNLNFDPAVVSDVQIGQGSHFGSPDNVNFLTNSTPAAGATSLVLTVALPFDVTAAGLYWDSSVSGVTVQFYNNATAVGLPQSQSLPSPAGTFYPFFGVISTQAFNRLTVTETFPSTSAASEFLLTPDVQYAQQSAPTIPEPSALGLMAMGLPGILLLGRKRKPA